MLKYLTLRVIFCLWPSLAFGQTYLVEPTFAACQTRSAAQCTALGCDGVKTKWWWNCQVLASAIATCTGGTLCTTALQIIPGTSFDATTTTKTVVTPTGLTTGEQSAVQTETALGTALTYQIGFATFEARLTAPQLSAVNANVPCGVLWTAVKGSAVTNINSPTVNNFVSCLLGQGIVTSAQTTALLAPQSPLVSP